MPGERTLAAGQDALERALRVARGRAASSCARPTPSSAASYAIDVRHEVVNTGAAPLDAAAVPAAGARRQPAARRVELLLHLHRPGRLHRGQASSTRSTSRTSRRARPSTDQRADDGWIAMVQHYFASAWLPKRRRRRASSATQQGRRQPVLPSAMVLPLGELAPGATQGARRTLFAGPQEEKKLEALAPGPRAGQGLRLVHHPGQAAVLAARPAAQAARQLGLGDRRAGGAAQDRLLLAQRQRLPLDGQDEGHQPARHGAARALQGQAAADAAGDDAHLPRGEGQPAGRLPADPGADAVLHRAVLGAAVVGRDAQRAVDRLDHTTCRPRIRSSSCRC